MQAVFSSHPTPNIYYSGQDTNSSTKKPPFGGFLLEVVSNAGFIGYAIIVANGVIIVINPTIR